MPFDIKSLFSFDATKLDKDAFKKWLLAGAQLLEPAVITPGNLDKILFFDNLERLSDGLFSQFQDELATDGKIIVGDAVVTISDVDEYLGKFGDVPLQTREVLRSDPRLIRRLAKFSEEDQKLIVGNPLLLLALQTLLPILFKFLLNRFND